MYIIDRTLTEMEDEIAHSYGFESQESISFFCMVEHYPHEYNKILGIFNYLMGIA